jgi:ion channel
MTPSNQISVLSPLLVGTAATFCTIIVHALILGIIVTQVRRGLQRGRVGIGFWTDVMFVTGATLLALAGHLVEIGLWALAFELCGEFSNFAAAFYHSAVNYTTLGDDTVVMSARWRLLGPFEASAGMLMFGVSTAMIFAVTQRLIQTRFGELDR